MRSELSGVLRPSIVLAAALGLGACGTTYGTGTNAGAQTLKDITGLVTLGAAKDSGPPIAYESRPPIVAPPTTEVLPPPGSGATVENWPRDPDVLAREQMMAKAARDSEPENQLVDPGFRLPKQKVETVIQEDVIDDTLLSLSGAKKKQQEALVATAKSGAAGRVDENGVPIRTTLIEPPPDYRIPDPSAPQEFEEASTRKFLFFKGKTPQTPTAPAATTTDAAAAGGTAGPVIVAPPAEASPAD